MQDIENNSFISGSQPRGLDPKKASHDDFKGSQDDIREEYSKRRKFSIIFLCGFSCEMFNSFISLGRLKQTV